ncbi:type VI secretion system tip protein VgrG [Paraburkholderia sp. JHI2823]|uniref:type VI secretion system Vgr family protein n=1 Tax=Paraburkholderia sp. JHI2823 TaxID=3112960 RepID=UPI00317EFCC8
MASLFDAAGKLVSNLGAIPGRQAYFLDVPGADSAAQLSVVSFDASEKMGEPNIVRIVVTHPGQLERADYLSRDAVFRIVPDYGAPKMFSGYIERFSIVQTTKDFRKYEIVLKSHVGRLGAVTNTQIYQHQTTPEIMASILRRHDLREHQFVFRLRKQYPKHLFRFQYRIDDLAYLQMLMQKSGIYFYIVETEHGAQVVFCDDIDHYLYDPRLIVPYREAAGLEAGGIEAVTYVRTHMQTVPKSVMVADYNPDSAWERFRDEANVAPDDPTTYGRPYIYGTNHLDQKGAKWEAQLRHEAAIARQVVHEGESNVLGLQCARVLETDVVLPEAPKGQVIIEITHSGARDKAYSNSYKAIPADRRFRLELRPETWPRIAGTLSARICSPDKYTYGYLNSVGYYVVRFDVDFADWPKGGESVPLRLAKPFAGKLQTGMHFVALDNDEATITFRDGDPDKPEISGFHHHSQARDLVTNDRRWLSRNVIRTQKNNKLRMEDWEGQEGIKLSTEHSGKSQLNLGYLVNQKLEYRGEGFELRTSGYGAIRSGKGLLVTTYDQPRASGKQLDMDNALQHLDDAYRRMEGLAQAAKLAQVEAADLKAIVEVQQKQIRDLQEAVMLLSASSSIALVTPDSIHQSAGANLMLTAGDSADFGVLRRFRVFAGEMISLFAHHMGMKFVANRGKIQMEAQNDELELTSQQNMTITSSQGHVVMQAGKSLTLSEGGGAYIKLENGHVTIGSPAQVAIRMANFKWDGPDSIKGKLPGFQACHASNAAAATAGENSVALA